MGVAGLTAVLVGVGVGSAHASVGVIGPALIAVERDAYYDDHYGPFYNGYWAASGDYYYATAPNRPYVRDDGRHFRRVMLPGFRPVEGFVGTRSNGATAAR